MASFRKLPSGNYRAEVARLCERMSKVFPTKTAAKEWAARAEFVIREEAEAPIYHGAFGDLLKRQPCLIFNDVSEPSGKGFVYNGTAIRDKGEMLSLTDMREAAGRPENKRPAEWARKEGKGFVARVAEILNVAQGHIQAFRGGRGAGRGATFAHWQIGPAYARYLSPKFHMWCNSVVRAHMEGKPVGAELPAEVIDQIESSFGIMRMLSHKITEMEKALPLIASEMADRLVSARLAESALMLRSGKTAKQIWNAAGLPRKINA